jgi:hypothetical protein
MRDARELAKVLSWAVKKQPKESATSRSAILNASAALLLALRVGASP